MFRALHGLKHVKYAYRKTTFHRQKNSYIEHPSSPTIQSRNSYNSFISDHEFVFFGCNAVFTGKSFLTFRRRLVPSHNSTQGNILADLRSRPHRCKNHKYHFSIICPFLIPHASYKLRLSRPPSFDHPKGLTLNASPNRSGKKTYFIQRYNHCTHSPTDPVA